MFCKCGRSLGPDSDIHCSKCLEIIRKFAKPKTKLNKMVFIEELGKFLNVSTKEINIGDKNNNV